MKFEFIFIGKSTENWIREGCTNYINRINRYIKAELLIINLPISSDQSYVQKKKESLLILKKISTKDLVILLDDRGKQFTSEEFARQVNKWITSGKARILFIVGGPYGTDTLLQERSDMSLSFSKMTFTHQMIRPILLEQIYRGFTILKNEKYHH